MVGAAHHLSECPAPLAASLLHRGDDRRVTRGGGVGVQDVVEDSKKPLASVAALENLTGKRAWSTEEGPVVINTEGDTVVITESFDPQLAERVETEVFGAAAAK